MVKCKHKDTTKMSFKRLRGSFSIEICHHCKTVQVKLTEIQVILLDEFKREWNDAMLALRGKI